MNSNQQQQKGNTAIVCNYETFESSSEDEMSHGAFESEAQSFQNKENKVDSSSEKEQRRLERIRRKERKLNEKIKMKQE